ncbi:DUF418 domain-containing protein [Geomicrobium sp. JCM 19039]|uniref:DUF418 domain-containing protein n=1 Tax=Geomicrobium sp. JCM 19039 TaxID=1460636 RepID=UPI00045F464E|nr:DUF418 domain-containing protein [Geomicrobium sp. JCM 19039]GAK14345.1 hypothetical protein JCM19039_4257 [Geomicrobium sp. JCM 19039]
MKHQGISSNERIHTLDIVRGFAILGIALANMMHFKSLAQLDFTIFIEGFPLPDDTLNALSTLFISFFVEGKFYPMFSLLFGLGFYIFYSRAAEKNLRANRLFSRRLTFLMIVGIVHLFFFWHGDILFTYGVTGFLLLFFISRQPKTILIWATLLLFIYSIILAVMMGVNSWLMSLGTMFGGDFTEEMATMNAQANEVMANGSYLDILLHRLPESIITLLNVFVVIPSILPLFLIGLYMGKTGMFHNVRDHLHTWKKICIHSAWIGFLFSILTTALLHDFTAIPGGVAYGLAFSIRTFTGPILMLFYLSALVLLLTKESRQKMLQPIASVGRMALTNYLMQTLIFVIIFHGYGFGLFNQVGSFAGVILSVSVFIIQIGLSTLYLKKFNQGPMEWLWRKWTYKNV